MGTETLGVDVGGVIIDRVNDGTDTSFFSDNYLRTTAVPGVFDALRELAGSRFDGRVVLVSKCGQQVQEKTLRWLEHHQFYARTGISRSGVHFCRARREKDGICRELGVTHFVDDRLEVLGYLSTVSHLYLFQPRPNEVRRFARFLERVRQVGSWREILDDLLPAGERSMPVGGIALVHHPEQDAFAVAGRPSPIDNPQGMGGEGAAPS